jgi:lysophospholipase L1-like esterase
MAQIVLAPLFLAQGLYVRRTVPRLPEPPGPRAGVGGDGPDLRLLVLGDSAAAGVGADTIEASLTGQLVERLAPRYRVHWQLIAKTGATTRSTLETLRTAEPRRYEVIVTSLGVNDVTSGRRARTFVGEQRRLVERLRQGFAARLVVVCGLPPVGEFPALPQPLRAFLGSRSRLFDRLLRDGVAGGDGCVYLAQDKVDDPALMASDGFHPGPDIYRIWAEEVARVIEARDAGGALAGHDR